MVRKIIAWLGRMLPYLFFFRGKREIMSNVRAGLMVGLIVLVQVGDALSTKLGLEMKASEQNSAMSSFISNFGVNNFIVLKLVMGLVLGFFFWKRSIASHMLVMLYLLVIINNLMVITSK